MTLKPLPSCADETHEFTPHKSYSLGGYPLSLKEAIRLALQNNFDIEMAKITRKINVYDITAEEAIYDTTLTAEINYEVDKAEASTGGRQRQNAANWDIGVEKKFSWGSLLSFDFLNNRTSTTPSTVAATPAYSSDASVSLTQPLLYNSLGIIDRSTVKLVKLDVSKLDLDLLDSIEATIADVQKTYWDLVYAQGNLEVKKEALRIAKDFLTITKKQCDDGALEETDLFAAQANVGKRENELLEAHSDISDISDNLKLAMNFFADVDFLPTDKSLLNSISLEKNTNLLLALENRRDFKKEKLTIESQDITIAMKKNSRLPQLDVVGTFTANGLAREMLNALGESSGLDDPTYYVGLEFSVPFENRKARSEFKQAELEKAKAIWNLKKIEKEIFIDISKSLRALNLHKQQASHNEKIETYQEKKLKGEEKKYGFGRSSSDVIIRYQDDVLNARIALIKSLAYYEKALVDLKRNQNIILNEVDWKTYEEIR